MQNAEVKMTRERYFEMCEALGTEPNESEIPVEIDDFPTEVQEVFELYKLLRDEWEAMSGTYLGKNFIGISELFNLMDIAPADRKIYLTLLHLIDSVRSEQILQLKQNTQKPQS